MPKIDKYTIQNSADMIEVVKKQLKNQMRGTYDVNIALALNHLDIATDKLTLWKREHKYD